MLTNATLGISCTNYHVIVEALSNVSVNMPDNRKQEFAAVLVAHLQKSIQQITQPACRVSNQTDADWLSANLGHFSSYVSLSQLTQFNFSGVNAAEVLTLSQLAELCSIPSSLHGPQDVNRVMSAVKPDQFAAFFDILTPNIQRNASLYSSEVKEAFLQAVLVRGGLSSAAVPDSEVLQWVNVRLRPLLSSLSSVDVTPYFNIIRGRSCNISQAAVSNLDSLRSSFNNDTQTQIFSNILQLLTGPNGLGCYGGGSFYVFLKNSFFSFGLPDLSAFLSLIPVSRQQELLGSISPAELSEFLNGSNTVRNGSDLCTLLNKYNSTNQYLEKEPVVSAAVGRQTLGCVWSRALSASSQDEVDQWFNVRLAQYLPLLSSQLISPTQLSGASCLPYRKLVSILGNNYNYSATDFSPADVYSSIKAYLNSSDGTPRCYNPSNPLLNSTAWFSNNIGFFITFITLTDLQSFVSDSQIGVFLENTENMQLFNNSQIAANVITYYSTQIYIQNPNYNPLRLPTVLLCGAPASAFGSVGVNDSKAILERINKFCSRIDPQVAAVLATKFPTISTTTIQTLGNQSIGLTEGQLSSASPDVINSTLPTLSVITGWNQGQVNNIVQNLISGGFNINSGSSLVTLGTLIGGVPSATISNISSSELLSVSKNPTFINNIKSAPEVVQETYVQKIVSADKTKVVENVPDALAVYIPPVLLTSSATVDVSIINKKSWRQEQAAVLFETVASNSDNTEELSESILQGFTCTSVRTLSQLKVKQLVKACRPRAGRNKVILKESQLTCMYNYVKDDSSLGFSDFPGDMLLYYSYEKVQRVNCRSYFSALGGADFSVLSSVLNRQSVLFRNARDCLGVSAVGLTRDQVEVLGNMACTLDSSYIKNSDPFILEKLKNCGDLSDSQAAAVQDLLLTGSTPYGNPSTWNQETLEKLGILPLYFNRNFWGKIYSTVKKAFQKTFNPFIRGQRIPMWKQKRFFTECNFISRIKRGAELCTVRNITGAEIADPSFPADYDATQLDMCMDITVLKDNLAAVTEKVVANDMQMVILSKLNQLYPSGIPESVVKLLGPTSRVATVSDISKWNITTIDTLSLLMNSTNGDWNTNQSAAVIMRYLSVAGNTLGTAELNAIGSNLCSLDVSVLKTITADSLKNANAFNISSCSFDQKSALYFIANISFSTQRSNPATYYQFISPYLGGAPLQDIQALSTQNISMDILTFISLNLAVVKALNVTTVHDLLGVNIVYLKQFENSSVIQAWVANQKQSDLNTLNIDLQGGIPDPTTIPTTTAILSTTVTPTASANTTMTMANVITTTSNSTTGHVDNTTISANTAILNTTVTPTASANTTMTIASVITTTFNSTTGNVDNTTISATPAILNTTFTPTASVNTTMTMAGVITTTFNSTTGHVDNTTISANTAILNTTVTPTVSANTTMTIASVGTTTFNSTTGHVDNTTISATTAILNTTVTPTAGANTTMTIASVITTTFNSTTGHVDNTTISANTAILNTTVTPTVSANTTMTIASVGTTTFNSTTDHVDNTTISATTAILNTTVTPTASANTTMTIASVITTTFNSTTGHVDNTTISATTGILNTTVTPTVSANTTMTIASVITTTFNSTTGNVDNTTISATPAILNTTFTPTASVNTTMTMAGVITTTFNSTTGHVDNTTISANTAILNATVTPTVSANTTMTIASVGTTTFNSTTDHVDNTTISATTAILNTTVTPTASANTTMTIASVITTTFNSTTGHVDNTTISANTAILNTTVTPTVSANTTMTIASVITTTFNSTTGNVDNTTISATPAILNTTFTPTASVNTTMTMAGVITTTFNSTTGHVDNTTISATTAILNTTVTPTVSANTTMTIASVGTTTFNSTTGIVDNTTISASTGILNTTVTPTVSANTTMTIASVITTTFNSTTGNVDNTTISATPAILNTTFTPTASANTTMTMAGVITTTFNSTTGHVENTTISATTAILNTTVTPTVSANTTMTIASVGTTTFNSTTGHVDNTTISATTAILNTTVTPTASVNTTMTIASVITTTFNSTTGHVDNTTISATTAILNTTVTPTAGANTTMTIASVINTTLNSTTGNVDNTTISANTAILNTTNTPSASANTTMTMTSCHHCNP
ncbi:uncharacterized threonine-rich GPI-anchored glycoprotein PJ4664.02-like [Colossoma macropomum]|uniref:uncharacterized threonine-rich GPI-anchored glycoprotein PJ4664.02-like n=1 Tax=Colossoma macropomum TaxID=42526 RepID=UPI0018650C6B|nr:uncharacterized threonine-rich GPI-anchored glycoprotein PJ4664.02-like [Colossoma macropomum]